MIHRNREFNKKTKSKTLKTKRPDTFLFEAKKDFIVTKKINIEYKIYLFFKQCLRMVINSLTIMVSCLDDTKV